MGRPFLLKFLGLAVAERRLFRIWWVWPLNGSGQEILANRMRGDAIMWLHKLNRNGKSLVPDQTKTVAVARGMSAVVIVAMLVGACDQSLVEAQTTKSPATAPTNSGRYQWIVVKCDRRVLGTNYEPEKNNANIVADFPSEAQAKDYARQLDDKEPGLSPWIYNVYRRGNGGAATVIEQPIRKPESKYVDVPPVKTKSPLAGKKGTQKVGTRTAEVEFRPDGKVLIRESDGAGSIAGEWSERDGVVSVTTDAYRYSGQLRDNTILGKRYKRSDLKDEQTWTISLQNGKAAIRMDENRKAETKNDTPEGTYTRVQTITDVTGGAYSYYHTLQLRADGTGTLVTSHAAARREHDLKWRTEGSRIFFEFQDNYSRPGWGTFDKERVTIPNSDLPFSRKKP